MIELSDLTVAHGRGKKAHSALDAVSAELPAGVTYVVGPAGSGKTTLGRAVAGHVPETSGTITIRGRELSAEERVEWSAVASGPRTFGAHAPAEVLRAASARPTWDEGDFTRISTTLGVTEHIDSRGRSTSQSNALSAAIALAAHAPVTVLDDVVDGLDARQRAALGEELDAIAERVANGTESRSVIVTSRTGAGAVAVEPGGSRAHILQLESGRVSAGAEASSSVAPARAIIRPGDEDAPSAAAASSSVNEDATPPPSKATMLNLAGALAPEYGVTWAWTGVLILFALVSFAMGSAGGPFRWSLQQMVALVWVVGLFRLGGEHATVEGPVYAIAGAGRSRQGRAMLAMDVINGLGACIVWLAVTLASEYLLPSSADQTPGGASFLYVPSHVWAALAILPIVLVSAGAAGRVASAAGRQMGRVAAIMWTAFSLLIVVAAITWFLAAGMGGVAGMQWGLAAITPLIVIKCIMAHVRRRKMEISAD